MNQEMNENTQEWTESIETPIDAVFAAQVAADDDTKMFQCMMIGHMMENVDHTAWDSFKINATSHKEYLRQKCPSEKEA